MAQRRLLLLVGGIAAAVVLGLSAIIVVETGAASGTRRIGGAFAMTEMTGRPMTDADLRGRPTALFFGFTRCPASCPVTLQVLTTVLGRMGADADRLNVVFVTVDPERDTPEALRDYLGSFDPRIRGVTGTPAQLAAMAAAFKVQYRRVPLDGGDYTMDPHRGGDPDRRPRPLRRNGHLRRRRVRHPSPARKPGPGRVALGGRRDRGRRLRGHIQRAPRSPSLRRRRPAMTTGLRGGFVARLPRRLRVADGCRAPRRSDPASQPAFRMPAWRRVNLRTSSMPRFPSAGRLAAFVALAFAPSTATAGDVAVGDIVIHQPWARATPGGAQVGGGYLTVENKGKVADRLTGGSFTASNGFQFHTMTMDGGIMRMRPTGPLEIPAGRSVTLDPSGIHIMFEGLKRGLKKGETIPGTLIFEHAGTVPVTFEVEGIAAKGPGSDAKAGHAMPGMDMD